MQLPGDRSSPSGSSCEQRNGITTLYNITIFSLLLPMSHDRPRTMYTYMLVIWSELAFRITPHFGVSVISRVYTLGDIKKE